MRVDELSTLPDALKEAASLVPGGIGGHGFLRSLTAQEAEVLTLNASRRSFPAGARLVVQGHVSPGLLIVNSGLVAITVGGDDDREVELALLGKGECIGEMSLLTGEACSATASAVTDVEALFIDPDAFRGVLASSPALARALNTVLSQRLAGADRYLTARAPARLTILASACPADTFTALGAAVGASLARQTGERVLLLDLRAERQANLASFAPGAAGPSLAELLHDRSRLVEYEAPTGANNGLAGARVAALAGCEGEAPGNDDMVAAIEWLRRIYDHAVVLEDADQDSGVSRFRAAERRFVVVQESDPRRARQVVAASEEAEVVVLGSGHIRSDNGFGGLRDAGEVKRVMALAGVSADQRLHLLPSDDGVLARMADERSLITEQQPLAHFSQAVARLARRIGGTQVGIALGAGMAKGFAHIGVLRVLQDAGVPIDYIAGTSIGSIVGSTYAGGMALDRLEGLMQGADNRLRTLAIPTKALLRDSGLRKVLTGCHDRAPTAEFDELLIPFAAVATELGSGRKTVFRQGLTWKAVQASVSFPGLFPPTIIDDLAFVDGGLVEPVPSQTVRDMGADIVIGIDLTSPPQRNGFGKRERARVPGLIGIIWRTIDIMLGEITARSAGAADVTVQPGIGRSGLKDFSARGTAFIEAGANSALEALPQLHALLPATAGGTASRTVA